MVLGSRHHVIYPRQEVARHRYPIAGKIDSYEEPIKCDLVWVKWFENPQASFPRRLPIWKKRKTKVCLVRRHFQVA